MGLFFQKSSKYRQNCLHHNEQECAIQKKLTPLLLVCKENKGMDMTQNYREDVHKNNIQVFR
jgi:putative ribosome biogenesis GTPase RsgA